MMGGAASLDRDRIHPRNFLKHAANWLSRVLCWQSQGQSEILPLIESMPSTLDRATRSLLKRGRFGISLALVLGALVGATRVHAQLDVQFTPTKKTYIAHEAITGVLRLTNNAGRDIVLGGKAGRSWLDFQVTDGRGHLLPTRRDAVKQAPIVLRNNQPYEFTVIVNQNYAMGETGLYRIKPNVYFPPVDRYFSTPVLSVQVTDGRPFWSQPFGVPPGREGAGTYREYSLINFANLSQKELYVRLSDKSSGQVLTTFSLGRMLTVHPPTYGVDSQNRMHVLHMVAPKAYAHVVVDVDGQMLTREIYYEKESDRPKLVTISDGSLGIYGGMTAEEHDTPYEEREFRKLSELPPGMPLLAVP